MTLFQRVKTILTALFTLFCAVALCCDPKDGYYVVLLLVCVTVTLRGLGNLIYFFTMARHMVDGKIVLYRGIVQFDLGMITLSLNSIPVKYVMLYLLAGTLFSGVIDLLRAREEKKLDSPGWKLKLLQGGSTVVISLSCFFALNSPLAADYAVYIYSAGLFGSAVLDIIAACKRSAIVYIP